MTGAVARPSGRRRPSKTNNTRVGSNPTPSLTVGLLPRQRAVNTVAGSILNAALADAAGRVLTLP